MARNPVHQAASPERNIRADRQTKGRGSELLTRAVFPIFTLAVFFWRLAAAASRYFVGEMQGIS